MPRRRPQPLGADLAALIRAAVRNPAETTPLSMLADELAARGHPAGEILHRHLAGHETSRSAPLGYSVTWYSDTLPISSVTHDRVSGEPVSIRSQLEVAQPVRDGDWWNGQSNPGPPRPPAILASVAIGHTEPPPTKKIWNHSRTKSRGFTTTLDHAAARDWIDRHSDAAFRRVAHRYLDRHVGSDPRYATEYDAAVDPDRR